MRRYLVDHDEIKRLVEQEDAYPALMSSPEYEENIPKIEVIHIAHKGDDAQGIEWDDFFNRMANENMVVLYDDSYGRPQFSVVSRSESTYFEDPNAPEDRQLPDSGDEHVQKENIHTTEPPEGEPEI